MSFEVASKSPARENKKNAANGSKVSVAWIKSLARRRLILDVRLLGGASGIQSGHTVSPALLFVVAEAFRFTGPTVPEDMGSGDVLGFADWAGHQIISMTRFAPPSTSDSYHT